MDSLRRLIAFAAAAAVSLPDNLFRAPQIQGQAPTARRSRIGTRARVPLKHCRCCNKHVAGPHLCKAPFIASAPRGFRWEHGQLVRRAQS